MDGKLNKFLTLLSCLILLSCVFSVSSLAYSTNLTYDVNGNLLNNGEFIFEYNEANLLSRVRDASNNRTLEEYEYDYAGEKSVKVEYFIDGSNATTYYFSKDYEEIHSLMEQ